MLLELVFRFPLPLGAFRSNAGIAIAGPWPCIEFRVCAEVSMDGGPGSFGAGAGLKELGADVFPATAFAFSRIWFDA